MKSFMPANIRVLIRSNEDEPLIIGTLIRYEEIHGTFIPVVKDEITNKEVWSMGQMREYTDELYNELMKYRPIEQWNYLLSKEAEHCQYKEHKGIKYRTFVK